MITKEAARNLEDRFLSALENAQHAYEDIIAAEAWKALGYETFTEWWSAKVAPKMRALELRPKKEVATDAVFRIVEDQENLPKAQRLLQREVADLTGLTRRRVGQMVASRSPQGKDFPQDDQGDQEEEVPPGMRRRSMTGRVDWNQAENMARKGMSFGAISKKLGVDESTIRRDIAVRRARAEADPDFVVNEQPTQRHHDQSAACEIAPFPDLLKEIRLLLNRAASGRFYTLSQRDKRRLASVIAEIVQADKELAAMLLASLKEE